MLFLLFSSVSLQAAHLIGGEITYQCLGNNDYAIKLRVYRDCGGGGANFDNIARIAIYDQNNQLLQSLSTRYDSVISMAGQMTSNPCITVPANLCAEYVDYRDTVNLPPRPGGYLLVHQRCCRNASIGNIPNPGSYGNTYSIEIPSNDSLCNSSPQINLPPDNVICLNLPARIQLSASDADGDSLSYSLCSINAGGGQTGGQGCNAVIPNPPCPPPFNPIPFRAPYSISDPLPAANPFQLDPVSGLLTGTPNQLGIYVAGLCVSEWRDGQLLSTVRLDYQFAVSTCAQVVTARMTTPAQDPLMLCNGLSVSFESRTQNSLGLLWDFGDPSNPNDTSSAPNPTYTYSAPGTYRVRLVANPGTACSDTTEFNFEIKPPVIPEILQSGIACFEVQDFRLEAIGALPNNPRFLWLFGGDANLDSATGSLAPASLQWASPGLKPLELQVFWDSCRVSLFDTVFVSNTSATADAGPNQNIRRGATVQLRGSAGQDFYWWASRPVEFDNPFSRSPQVRLRPEDDSVYFYLRVTDAQGCTGLDSMLVWVAADRYAEIYNLITPNGDGRNDFFDLSVINPNGNCPIEIMNRWGKVVYRREAYANDWEGQNNGGDPLPDGTYYWLLRCSGEERSGPITILRGQ